MMSDAERRKHLYVKNETFINGVTGAVEQNLHDKKAMLPDGEWQKEPDRVSWNYNGFPCLIVRGFCGNLCGYVGVPKTHPAHGKGYDDVDVRVHGGLTYANECDGDGEKGICHLTESKEEAWWLGFDCAHSGDLVPSMSGFYEKYKDRTWFRDDTYRNYDYVKAEVEKLADQLSEMKG